jgi:dTMP kinase
LDNPPWDVPLDESALAGMGSGTRGLLITFEGVDGSGKTTQLARLAAALEAAGYDVVTTREPGGTVLGEAVRLALLDRAHESMSHRAEALLYAAARAQLVEKVIRPALDRGCVVLCDRYMDSSFAYQGFARELGYENLLTLNMWATDCLVPDLTFVLLIDAAARGARMPRELDRVEAAGDDFFARVDDGYRWLVDEHPHRIRAVDAEGSVAEVFARIAALVTEELGLAVVADAGSATA